MTLRVVLLCITLALPRLHADQLPELHALEALEGGRGRILGSAPHLGRLVLMQADSLLMGSASWHSLAPAAPRALDRPMEADSRAGLRTLVIDAAAQGLMQLNRDLLAQAWESFPPELDLASPDLLAISASRSLVVGDSRSGRVFLRRPGENWQRWLDFAQAGPLQVRSLEVVGECVALLDASSPSRLLLGGTQGGGQIGFELPNLLALHRGGDGDLFLLFEEGQGAERRWLLQRWPEFHLSWLRGTDRPPLVEVARYLVPTGKPVPRDFISLGPGDHPILLVALAGRAAELLSPVEPARP